MASPGGKATTLGGETAISGDGQPRRHRLWNAVPAEFSHWIDSHKLNNNTKSL